MGNYPARQLGDLPPERPSNIPSMDEVGDPFTANNCEGYSPEEMQALNAEFVRRWNAGEWSENWYAQAVKIFQNEVARR